MRVAVASRSFSKHPILRQELVAKYTEVTFNDSGASLAGAELVRFLSGHEAAIIALERIDESILSSLPSLAVISKYGVGLDMIDMEAMRQRGVRLGWTPGVNKGAVAELTICMMIAALRRVVEGNQLIRDGRFQQLQGRELSRQTVGVLGCGHVGKEVVRFLKPFQCRVLAYDLLNFADFYQDHGVRRVGFDELLAESDVLSIHVPLTEATCLMLGARELALMKPGSILINLARGGIVDEQALKGLLIGGHLAAAAFDVFSNEPPTDRELLNLRNFIATPHIGGSSEEAILAMGRSAIHGLDNAIIPGVLPATRVGKLTREEFATK